MKILVVLAVLAAFGLLRFLRANLLTLGRRVVDRDLRPPPVRIHCADSLLRHQHLHGNRLARGPGLHVLEPGAPRRSLPAARPVHDGEAVHAVPRGDGRRRFRCSRPRNVYVQMNAPLQPPYFARTVHPASPSEITVHDKKIDLDAGDNPFRQLEKSNPAGVPPARRERAPGLLSKLRLLPRRQHVSQRHVRARAGPDPDQLPRHDPACFGRRFCSGESPREAPAFPTKGGPGTRPCPPGRSS